MISSSEPHKRIGEQVKLQHKEKPPITFLGLFKAQGRALESRTCFQCQCPLGLVEHHDGADVKQFNDCERIASPGLKRKWDSDVHSRTINACHSIQPSRRCLCSHHIKRISESLTPEGSSVVDWWMSLV